MINIYYMGKHYKVKQGLTIQKALESVGYKLLRGCGCRGGFCGACGTIYRVSGNFKLKVGLACQTVVEENMRFILLPYFPENKAIYDIENIKANADTIISLYPELARCLQCNACTKICPQDIKVMDYIACAIKGDIKGISEKSFNCIMCGLCASRCPGELVQYHIALLGRRLYGKYVAKNALRLQERVTEIEDKKFESEYKNIMNVNETKLKELYEQRDIEE
ncbi:4Fe-4S dicluster domain-containing protein [bacterium]